MRVQHLFAAKLSISEHLFTIPLERLKPFFKSSIQTSNVPLRWGDSSWAFMDTLPIILEGRELITGRLARGRDEDAEVMVQESGTVSTKNDNIPNKVTKANFLFDYKTEIVVFEEKHSRISKIQFIEMFKRLIISNEPDIGKLESELIPIEENLMKEIKKFKMVNFAKFDLKPANWDDDDEFSDLSDELKSLKTTKATQVYESQNGLNIDAGLFRKPVNMVVAGYGKLHLTGLDLHGHPKQLDSKNELLTDTVETPDETVEQVAINYLRFILKAVQQHVGASRNEEY